MDTWPHFCLDYILEHFTYSSQFEDNTSAEVLPTDRNSPCKREQRGKRFLFLQMFYVCFKERKGRRIQETLIEGDIVVRNRDPGDPSSLNAHLTDPDRLWPNGIAQLGVFKRTKIYQNFRYL